MLHPSWHGCEAILLVSRVWQQVPKLRSPCFTVAKVSDLDFMTRAIFYFGAERRSRQAESVDVEKHRKALESQGDCDPSSWHYNLVQDKWSLAELE